MQAPPRHAVVRRLGWGDLRQSLRDTVLFMRVSSHGKAGASNGWMAGPRGPLSGVEERMCLVVNPV